MHVYPLSRETAPRIARASNKRPARKRAAAALDFAIFVAIGCCALVLEIARSAFGVERC